MFVDRLVMYTVGTENTHCQEGVVMTPNTALVQDNGEVPVTKLRNLRVDEALWQAAKKIADARRETLSAVMKRALVEYVEKHGGKVDDDE
jgi:hypothetical protein